MPPDGGGGAISLLMTSADPRYCAGGSASTTGGTSGGMSTSSVKFPESGGAPSSLTADWSSADLNSSASSSSSSDSWSYRVKRDGTKGVRDGMEVSSQALITYLEFSTARIARITNSLNNS